MVLSITSVGQPAHALVSVAGRLDGPGIARLRKELACWCDGGPVIVSVDLFGVSEAEPGLARALAWARLQLHQQGGDLVVSGAADQLRRDLTAEVSTLESFPNWHSDWPRPEVLNGMFVDPADHEYLGNLRALSAG